MTRYCGNLYETLYPSSFSAGAICREGEVEGCEHGPSANFRLVGG